MKVIVLLFVFGHTQCLTFRWRNYEMSWKIKKSDRVGCISPHQMQLFNFEKCLLSSEYFRKMQTNAKKQDLPWSVDGMSSRF